MNSARFILVGIILACIVMLLGGALIGGALLVSIQSQTAAQPARAEPTVSAAQRLEQTSGPRVGALAPDFELGDLEQRTVRLSNLRGKVVLLNFWATWCGPCSAEMPNIEKVTKTLSPGDIQVLAINQGENSEQVRGYADLYRLTLPILLDSKNQVGRAYRVQALPTTIFIDREGIVREIHIGGPMTVDFIESHIKSLLGTTP